MRSDKIQTVNGNIFKALLRACLSLDGEYTLGHTEKQVIYDEGVYITISKTSIDGTTYRVTVHTLENVEGVYDLVPKHTVFMEGSDITTITPVVFPNIGEVYSISKGTLI